MYSIGRKGKRDTSLVYRLEVPEEPGPVQEALRIGKEGNILISIKSARRMYSCVLWELAAHEQ